MILSLTIALLTSPVAPQWHQDNELPSPETVREMVSGCDVADAVVSFDDLLQSEVVTFPEDAAFNEMQLACLAEVAFHTGYEFLVPEGHAPAFYELRAELAAPWNRNLAAGYLAELGKLDNLPVKGEGDTDAQFARRLEKHCAADGALSSEFGVHSIGPDWVDRQGSSYEKMGKAVFCLMAAGTLSNFEIGLIGNEQVPAEIGEVEGS